MQDERETGEKNMKRKEVEEKKKKIKDAAAAKEKIHFNNK